MKESNEIVIENEINIYNNKNKKESKLSRNIITFDKNMQSENRLINIRNEIESKGSTIASSSIAEETQKDLESNNNNKINNNEINNDIIEPKNNKGFFRRGLDWISNTFNEISFLWKKEELVDAYDANGNLVKRPKNKIPYKKNRKEINIEEEKIKDVAKKNTLNIAQDGINYGILFN